MAEKKSAAAKDGAAEAAPETMKTVGGEMSEFYEAIGQKGGKVVKEKYGADFYETIGHKGGQKVKKLIADAKLAVAAQAAAEAEKNGQK
jgi:general stress protein YciG